MLDLNLARVITFVMDKKGGKKLNDFLKPH